MSTTATDKPKETTNVRMSFDLKLNKPLDAAALKRLAVKIEDACELDMSGDIDTAKWTEIVPAEPNFDWQGQ